MANAVDVQYIVNAFAVGSVWGGGTGWIVAVPELDKR
jgi:hypothetical protein